MPQTKLQKTGPAALSWQRFRPRALPDNADDSATDSKAFWR